MAPRLASSTTLLDRLVGGSPLMRSTRLNTELYSQQHLPVSQLGPPNVTSNVIPKHLFTFWWPLDDIPDYVAACLATFHRLNPTWSIHVLYPNVHGVEPPPFQNLNADNDDNWVSLQHTSEWYRAAALARYGGVWMDPTSIMLRPIESWVDMSSTAVQGWSFTDQAETMEPWALAAPANSEFMRLWMAEFRLAYKMGPGTYCENLATSVVGAALRPWLPYLAMHAAYRHTLTQLPDGPVSYMPPSTNANQPFGWLQKFDFNSQLAVEYLFGNATWSGVTQAELGNTSFLKLRGEDRAYVGDLYSSAANGSYVARLLVDSLPTRPPSPPPTPPSPPPPSPPMWYNVALNTDLPTMLLAKPDNGIAAATAATAATTPATPANTRLVTPTIPSPSETTPPSSWIQDGQEADLPTSVAAASSSSSSTSLASAAATFDGEQIMHGLPGAPSPSFISPPPPPAWFEDGIKSEMPSRSK